MSNLLSKYTLWTLSLWLWPWPGDSKSCTRHIIISNRKTHKSVKWFQKKPKHANVIKQTQITKSFQLWPWPKTLHLEHKASFPSGKHIFQLFWKIFKTCHINWEARTLDLNCSHLLAVNITFTKGLWVLYASHHLKLIKISAK